MYCYWRYFLFVFVVSIFAAGLGLQCTVPIAEKRPVIKKTLRPWKKWLIGAGAATAGIVIATVLWRLSVKSNADSNNSREKLTPNNDQRLLGSSVNKLASDMPLLTSDHGEHEITDRGVVIDSLTVNVAQGAAIIKSDHLPIVAGFATQGDVLQAQRLLIAMPNLMYLPYPVQQVNSVQLLPECVICFEPTNIAYVFYQGSVQRWWQCQKCWHGTAQHWVNGQSPERAPVDNLKILIADDYVEEYRNHLQEQVVATAKFVHDLCSARDRSFIKNISGDALFRCRHDGACTCAAYKAQRKEFSPAQLLQEALVVGGMEDASDFGHVVEQLVKYFDLRFDARK